jgi:hypothetical protein
MQEPAEVSRTQNERRRGVHYEYVDFMTIRGTKSEQRKKPVVPATLASTIPRKIGL